MRRVFLSKYVILWFFFWPLVLFGLLSCTHGQVISPVDRPLLELQKAAASTLPAGMKSFSENAREFYSNPFKLRGNTYEAAKPTDDLYFIAHVLVLGDSRPYKIEIRVDRFEDSQRVGSDDKLEKRLKNEILADLAKRRENRNVIDSFRPF